MELTDELRSARRSLEHVDGCEIVEDLTWNRREEVWVLQLELTIDAEGSSFVPARSRWCVLVSEVYPLGKIDFMPAENGGLLATFAHQSYNGPAETRRPWRSGRLCLEDGTAALDRQAQGAEPRDAETRLSWLVRRALLWLQLAASDRLRVEGEPFELPAFPEPSGLLAFNESEDTFRTWSSRDVELGYCSLKRLPSNQRVLVAHRFVSESGEEILTTEWGSSLQNQKDAKARGIWLRLPEVPHLEPWQAPATWQELIEICGSHEIDLHQHLRRLFQRLRKRSRHSQQSRPILLLGFPIPEKIGEPPFRIHWLAINLPLLAAEQNYADGFRKNERGYWLADRRSLSGSKALSWRLSECWSRDELEGRGRASVALRASKVLVVGAGALGSALCELLVREGTQHLVVMDSETIDAENLVRHSLTLEEVGAHKATAIAARLNRISPHAKVQPIAAKVEGLSRKELDLLERAEVVIDCTANDDVLRFLATRISEKEKRFFSFSLGSRGKRIYCFASSGRSFAWNAFEREIAPWSRKDRGALEGHELHRGLGCWHPALPMRLDAVWMAAIASLRYLEAALQTRPTSPSLTVFGERSDSNGLPSFEELVSRD